MGLVDGIRYRSSTYCDTHPAGPRRRVRHPSADNALIMLSCVPADKVHVLPVTNAVNAVLGRWSATSSLLGALADLCFGPSSDRHGCSFGDADDSTKSNVLRLSQDVHAIVGCDSAAIQGLGSGVGLHVAMPVDQAVTPVQCSSGPAPVSSDLGNGGWSPMVADQDIHHSP